jgi:hypothetical protein
MGRRNRLREEEDDEEEDAGREEREILSHLRAGHDDDERVLGAVVVGDEVCNGENKPQPSDPLGVRRKL